MATTNITDAVATINLMIANWLQAHPNMTRANALNWVERDVKAEFLRLVNQGPLACRPSHPSVRLAEFRLLVDAIQEIRATAR